MRTSRIATSAQLSLYPDTDPAAPAWAALPEAMRLGALVELAALIARAGTHDVAPARDDVRVPVDRRQPQGERR